MSWPSECRRKMGIFTCGSKTRELTYAYCSMRGLKWLACAVRIVAPALKQLGGLFASICGIARGMGWSGYVAKLPIYDSYAGACSEAAVSAEGGRGGYS